MNVLSRVRQLLFEFVKARYRPAVDLSQYVTDSHTRLPRGVFGLMATIRIVFQSANWPVAVFPSPMPAGLRAVQQLSRILAPVQPRRSDCRVLRKNHPHLLLAHDYPASEGGQRRPCISRNGPNGSSFFVSDPNRNTFPSGSATCISYAHG